MIYNNQNIRKPERLLDIKDTETILRDGEYGYLSMYSKEDGVYGLPISYAWDGEQSIYLHCAKEGKKLRIMDDNNDLSFTVVGKTELLPEKFSTKFESVIIGCKGYRVLDNDEKMKALKLILEKYSPDHMENGIKYANRAFEKTEIIRLDIIEWCGKGRR